MVEKLKVVAGRDVAVRAVVEEAWLAEPPIELRSALTARPVLAGFVPGVTATVSRTASPGAALFGEASPPVGEVGEPQV